MAKQSHKRTGVRVGKFPGRKGWYLIWYESRENRRVDHVVADPNHGLHLASAKPRGVIALAAPHSASPYAAFLHTGDVIMRVGKVDTNTPASFTQALQANQGRTVGILVNKGGKFGGIRRNKKAGDTRDIAERGLARWIESRDRKSAGLDPVPGKIAFTEIVDMFLKWAATPASGYSPGWISQINLIMRRHRERWKHLNASELTPAVVTEWFDTFAGGVSLSTAANSIKPLRRCFDLAIKRGYIKDNPTTTISIKQPRQTTPKYLAREQIETLLECARILDAQRLVPTVAPRTRTALTPHCLADIKRFYNADGTYDTARIRFFLLTGLRKSQLTSLTWIQYDTARGTITLESSREHTEKSKRVTVIPLPDDARLILDGQPQNSNYIFPNIVGAHDTTIAHRFARIAALFRQRGGGKVHIHMLRHTALTYLLAATGDIAAVQAYAGHADIRMTQRYAHILPSKLAAITKGFTIPQAEPQHGNQIVTASSVGDNHQ